MEFIYRLNREWEGAEGHSWEDKYLLRSRLRGP